MRVITGSAKGRILFGVPGDSTRPITDRVKEALFSILAAQGAIEDCRFLDLFGGTGAVGIEALSRGAAEAVFCEKDRRALAILHKNLALTGLADQARVVAGDAFAFLQRTDAGPFDLVYIAPPQYRQLWQKALLLMDAHPTLLAAEGQVIVQIHPKEDHSLSLSSLARLDERTYGSTLLVFYGHATQE
ncbi:16S rRNA (guanine(966)-N(2))-methyltransferase RsmD [Candidatus Amarolinea aalborgensis]|uniref:16S rRNA (guanine(966)-N(2))-methyltransferase RsmD n=1 Tax=Candidatus Amarolinea aalborgensis TaxID=2249329 RepID=UPI003BFA25D1